jgi:hypothetical protein
VKREAALDAVLLRAWTIDDEEDGWTDAVMEEAERLLPILVKAGYARTDEQSWSLTEAGAERALALERAAEREGRLPTQPVDRAVLDVFGDDKSA